MPAGDDSRSFNLDTIASELSNEDGKKSIKTTTVSLKYKVTRGFLKAVFGMPKN